MVNSLAGKKAGKSSVAVSVLFSEPGNRASSGAEGTLELFCRPGPIVFIASDNKDEVKAGAAKGTSELRIPKEGEGIRGLIKLV